MAAAAPADIMEALAPLGLDEKKTTMLSNKPAHAANLLALATAGGAGVGDGADKLTFFLEAATTLKDNGAAFAGNMGAYIIDGRLDVVAKVKAGVKFLNKLKGADAEFDAAAFEAATGVGVTVTDADMVGHVEQFMKTNHDALVEQRYAFPTKDFISNLRNDPKFKWGSAGVAKKTLDAKVLELLGPQTAADKAAKKKAGGKKKGGAGKDGGKKGGKGKGKVEEVAPPPVPESNPFEGRALDSARNSEALKTAHAAATGGTTVTRFPPEPNGYLHIGHAKSMNLNFNRAFEALGVPTEKRVTIFRYDDTNPEAESQEYIDSQADNVAWLGWKPARVTHSSDYFDTLHALAVKLIKSGDAFVCHQTPEGVKASREAAKVGDLAAANSPWRDRSVEENLAEFEKMRLGLYPEGGATLRMKMDMGSTVSTMWDPMAYRIKYVPHPRTGDKWCIYPSYDFTHCIVDSLENIDYSLCTLEFEQRRESYFWLLDKLDMWRPNVFEFSRLNITRTVLSKRKIIKLVTSGVVQGWDDPRLLTINGLRRRGYTPSALNAFCDTVGVTRNENTTNMAVLEHHARLDLDASARRAFGVLEPLKITLTNMAGDWSSTHEVPDFPKDPAAGAHVKTLTSTLFIDRSDFRLVDDKKYYGLAPGKTVGLRYAGILTATEVVMGPGGVVVEVKATYSPERSVKPKGNLHWVSGKAPVEAEVRLYEPLFTVDAPDDAPGSWEDYINPTSQVIVKGALVDAHLMTAPHFTPYQFERTGYFVVDPDSNPSQGKLVFNRIVTLKESAEAKGLRSAAPAAAAASS